MAGAVGTDIIAARLSIGFCADGAEDGADGFPGFLRAAGHNAGAVERAFFAAGYAGAHIHQAGRFHLLCAADGIFEKRVAAVDDQISGGEQGQQFVNYGVYRFAGLHHQHNAARFLQKADKFFQCIAGGDALFRHMFYKLFGFGGRAVINSHFKPVARHVAHQVLTHDGKTNQTDFTVLRHNNPPYK